MPEPEEIIQAAARLLLGTTLDLLQADPHSWSTRGCGTCAAVGAIVGRPFGCYRFAAEKKAREAAPPA